MNRLKIKFERQQYQIDAVNAICDIFSGANIKESEFTINIPVESSGFIEGDKYQLGYANELTLSEYDMLQNVKKIQRDNNLFASNTLNGNNFDIEMETGTGKTYVYINTILELNKLYGMTKFIIVVPSVAIREGTKKSFEITKEHFKNQYDGVNYNCRIYETKNINMIREFATNRNIEIMIMNIDKFNREINKINDNSLEGFEGYKPIDLIAGCNPIVIIDEPQSVDGTEKAKSAIKSLNPLVTLRYSATHKDKYNLMYRLTPVDAYQQRLVKQIELSSILSEQSENKPYIKLISVSDKNGYVARVEINVKQKDGSVKRKTVSVKYGHDLWEKSGFLDYYEGSYIVDNIDCLSGNESIEFNGGDFLTIGETIGDIDEDFLKRAQIKATIEHHLEKEYILSAQNVKVLSLFFIDKVSHYRDYDSEGNPIKGKYAIWFEEEFEKALSKPRFQILKKNYENLLSFNKEEVHDGYFSTDKKGKVKDTRESARTEDSTYDLIMKDKEKLLSFDSNLRFIFSHSALKEGWDNPNVFQICTLVESKTQFTKRQKIGRGLRLSVDQTGKRLSNYKFNTLTVVANESYKEFANGLQKELEKDYGYKFGYIEDISFTGIILETPEKDIELSQDESILIYNHFKSNKLIDSRGKVLNELKVQVNESRVNMPDGYNGFMEKVCNVIRDKCKTIEVKDANAKRRIKMNKEVYLSEEFKELWDKIKHKTTYSVEMDLDRFKEDCVKQIKYMSKINKINLKQEDTQMDINNKGVEKKGGIRESNAGYMEVSTYPDFIRRICEATKITRKTLIHILHESKRLEDFYNDPEKFIKNVSKIINNTKRNLIVDGIKYEQTGKFYDQKLFNIDNEENVMYGYTNKESYLDRQESNSSLYDAIVTDSNVEKEFADDCEVEPRVKLYAKLPSYFKIPTPIGNYNPDWVVVFDNDGEERIFFVAETKSSLNSDERRETENKKIVCGRKHFEVTEQGIVYKDVTNFHELIFE